MKNNNEKYDCLIMNNEYIYILIKEKKEKENYCIKTI